ncbi:hypothetical protein Salat_0173900 [Sesamum alatum]|uniref:Uncharacterized protein n=1 Tax=Sesamum alatum TaxID=300844 RepID=A0AAE2CXL6_9LAMI|nr:hypothetical protein Salat_0173900 [Sesamum alatum]
MLPFVPVVGGVRQLLVPSLGHPRKAIDEADVDSPSPSSAVEVFVLRRCPPFVAHGDSKRRKLKAIITADSSVPSSSGVVGFCTPIPKLDVKAKRWGPWVRLEAVELEASVNFWLAGDTGGTTSLAQSILELYEVGGLSRGHCLLHSTHLTPVTLTRVSLNPMKYQTDSQRDQQERQGWVQDQQRQHGWVQDLGPEPNLHLGQERLGQNDLLGSHLAGGC